MGGGGRYIWSQVPSGGLGIPYLPPVPRSSGGHRSGRYASYWSAFLFVMLPSNLVFISLPRRPSYQRPDTKNEHQMLIPSSRD